MKKEIICTVCPRGCQILAEGDGESVLTAEGYGCKRGLEYANTEYAHPVRILTTTVKLEGVQNDLLPVRSNKPLPKEKIMDCMEMIRAAAVKAPVERYAVIISNICGTGVDIVATKNVEA
jgi:CxxC motif-containing protein